MKVVIVGAGIVGAACADMLTAAGVKDLHVVDSSFIGGGTTAAGMGHLVAMDDSPAQFGLTARSLELWRSQSALLGHGVEYDACGTLWVASDDEELAAAAGKVNAYKAAGIEAQLVSSAELNGLEPGLRPGLAGGMRVPDDAVIYPTNAARWLLDRASARGAEVTENRPVAKLEPGQVTYLDGKTERADIVINAAGSHAAELTPGLPIQPRKGHLAITDRYPGLFHHQVLELGYLKSAHSVEGPSVAFNVQPRKTGQLLIGSSREFAGWDESINQPLLTKMLARAVAYAPALANCQIIRTWTGFRPATPDKLPVIGEQTPGLWVAAGHEGLGITTCLGTAELLTQLLLRQKTNLDPKPFDPKRFAGATN